MSGRITMPAPPPAGVSSTFRWRPSPKVLRSTVSSRQSPWSSARPVSDWPSMPGKASGNRVTIRTRHAPASSGRSVIRSRGSRLGLAAILPWDFGGVWLMSVTCRPGQGGHIRRPRLPQPNSGDRDDAEKHEEEQDEDDGDQDLRACQRDTRQCSESEKRRDRGDHQKDENEFDHGFPKPFQTEIPERQRAGGVEVPAASAFGEQSLRRIGDDPPRREVHRRHDFERERNEDGGG